MGVVSFSTFRACQTTTGRVTPELSLAMGFREVLSVVTSDFVIRDVGGTMHCIVVLMCVRTNHGVTWSCAPAHARKWWTLMKCRTRPTQVRNLKTITERVLALVSIVLRADTQPATPVTPARVATVPPICKSYVSLEIVVPVGSLFLAGSTCL